MTRIEFTRNLSVLIREMFYKGEKPIIDYVLRSTAEQQRLFGEGKSKCDGIIKISKHQRAEAGDLYFTDDKGNMQFAEEADVNPCPIRDKYVKWHKRWEEMGGKPILIWDAGHWE